MKILLFFISFYFISFTAISQHHVTFVVLDSSSLSPVAGASVVNTATHKGQSTNAEGKAFISAAKDTCRYTISRLNYAPKSLAFTISSDTTFFILLPAVEHQLEDVIIVSSSRNNSRLEDLPTKVEVIGAEEVAEENGINPANIVRLLGDIAGIQIQQTSAATGNADIRIQGVPGKYTQLLRDGMPLFGGYGGGFSILQIPPLDLQQIELVKGASSTLYGGGAIAGMVNLISKKPAKGAPVKNFTLSHSTLAENTANAFFSGRNQSAGYTFFAGGNLQNAVDVNHDGFSDVARVKSVFVHPRLFFYTDSASSLAIGYTFGYEDRNGGDLLVLKNNKSPNHQFFIQNKSLRNTADIIWDKKSASATWTIKGSASYFNRDINTNVFGMKAKQLSWYSEAAYSGKVGATKYVAGINWNGETFNKVQPDSSLLSGFTNYTAGAFVQSDVRMAPKLTAQAGLRGDYVRYDYRQNVVVLPRLSVMYKYNAQITARVSGGLGYKIPTPFNMEIDERAYHYLTGVSASNKMEHSYGVNADVNLKTTTAGWMLTYNQSIFISQVGQPLIITPNGNALSLTNAKQPLVSRGTESYVQIKKDELEIYLGYTYTDAQRRYDLNKHLPLTAKHKLATVVSFELDEHLRAGIEAAYTGTQYREDGSTTHGYLLTAAMFKYEMGKIAVVLNGENLSDYRQSRKEPVVLPPYNNPSFPEIWAPLDGRIVALTILVKW